MKKIVITCDICGVEEIEEYRTDVERAIEKVVSSVAVSHNLCKKCTGQVWALVRDWARTKGKAIL